MGTDIMKTLNLKVTAETHRRLRLLAAGRDQTSAELITALINSEWAATSKDLVKGK